jgi:hypothetical protein
MCIDYTGLNKACLIDPFPLPRIDQIMDSTSGCDLLFFQDAYSSFHQIPMSIEDKEHTTFIIVDDLFWYVSMPYGLKNAPPTFVCDMHKTLGDPIRDLVEVYVDDIIVKIKSCASLLDNLRLVFNRLRSTRTKLNMDKCVFGVTTCKLLSFLVSCQGIEANPEKIKTIKAMWPTAHIKDVQELTGCLAALSRFITRLAERALPFFKLSWKSRPFLWIEEAEEAFQELKQYLTSPPTMIALEPGEPLLLYIVMTTDVVSMVLVVEQLDPKSEEAPKIQPLEAHPASKLNDGPNTVPECHPSDADPDADNQEVTRPQLPGRGGASWTLGSRSPWSPNPWR